MLPELGQRIEVLDKIRDASLAELKKILFSEDTKALVGGSDSIELLMGNLIQLGDMSQRLKMVGLSLDVIHSTYETVKASLVWMAEKDYAVAADLTRISELYDSVEYYRTAINTIEGGVCILERTPERVRKGEFLSWYARARRFAPARERVLGLLAEHGQIGLQLPGVAPVKLFEDY